MATIACCDDISFHGFFFKSLGSLRAKPAVGFWFFVLVLRERNRGGGKVENRFLVFHFSIALVVGAVEMWESRLPLARFPRGSWKEWEACLWLSTLSTAPGISTALSHRDLRQRVNRAILAFCMRLAAS